MKKITKISITLMFAYASLLCRDVFSIEIRQGSKFTQAYNKTNESNCINTKHCGWYKIDEKTLGFNGEIEREKTYEEFIVALSTMHAEKLVVNSHGGDLNEAINIGTEIQERNLAISVEGYCLSACANYLLLVAKKISINGMVGFHEPTMLPRKFPWPVSWLSQPLFRLSKYILYTKQRNLYHSDEKIARFIKKTEVKDKGAGDGLYRGLYLPSKEELQELTGVAIQGNQDKNYVCLGYELFKETGDRSTLTYSPYGTSESYCKN